jgi:hypothetical protein
MNLTEFKKYANEKAQEYGINEHYITVMACIFGCHTTSEIGYTIQAWDIKKNVHITARQSNTSSCLNEFDNKLNLHFKEYSKDQEDIEI